MLGPNSDEIGAFRAVGGGTPDAVDFDARRGIEATVPVRTYMDRVLPWGETCRAAESRLAKLGWREAWARRWREIKKVNGVDANEAAYLAMIEFPPDLKAMSALVDWNQVQEADKAFVTKCREGLRIKSLPRKASIDEQIDWIGENMHRDVPEVGTAPCYAAISWLIDVRMNERVRTGFWATYQARRMSPGDKTPKKTAFVEDDAEDVMTAEREAEMRRRLGMGP